MWPKISILKACDTYETIFPILKSLKSKGPQFFSIKAHPYFPPGMAFLTSEFCRIFLYQFSLKFTEALMKEFSTEESHLLNFS